MGSARSRAVSDALAVPRSPTAKEASTPHALVQHREMASGGPPRRGTGRLPGACCWRHDLTATPIDHQYLRTRSSLEDPKDDGPAPHTSAADFLAGGSSAMG